MVAKRVAVAIFDFHSDIHDFPDGGIGHGFNLRVVFDRTQVGFPAHNGEFGHGGMASTYFWADPDDELVVVLMSQYLPYSGQVYSDMLHRLVHAAIVDR